MALETRIQLHSWDGDGGEYWMEQDIDVVGQQERLQKFRIINHRHTYPVNYFLKTPSGAIAVDSTIGNPSWPPVAVGQTFEFPSDGSVINIRIDNKTDWITGLS